MDDFLATFQDAAGTEEDSIAHNNSREHVLPELGGHAFVPLNNFMPDDDRYQNTCFIAAIVNLHTLIPGMTGVLELDRRTWKEVICLARAKWNNLYRYSALHSGQHDAADFLGSVLEDIPGFGFQL